ncbi:MAG: ABC transporter ATP-binding protein [Clostridiaceae bacterium]
MRKYEISNRARIIISFAKPYRFSFVNLFLCVLVTSFSGMLYPYIFGKLVDEVFYARNNAYFIYIVASYGVLFLGEQSLHLILNTTWAYLMTRFLFDIRRKVYEKILLMKAGFLSNMRTGDLAATINKDCEEFMNFIHWNIFYLTANILRLVLSVFFISLIDIRFALLMAVTVPLSVCASRIFAGIVKKKVESYREKYGRHISWAFEIIKGLREVRLLSAVKHVMAVFSRNCAALLRLKVSTNTTETVAERANALISLLSTLGLYILAGLLVSRGDITVGAFIAAVEYFSRGIPLLKGINDANMRIQSNMVSVGRVIDVLNEEDEKIYDGNIVNVTKGRIDFEMVSFGYSADEHVLRKINLTIKPGETIALVGRSGTGKSTMANLLLGLYRPDEGNISIDGQDISECSLKSLRNSIGMVHQEIILFDGNIRDNLLLAKHGATDEEIMEACEKAHIGDFIRCLPYGLDTVIGAGGLDFSGGQRQRIAIARVFLKNPKILIMDEAMSALDFEAEQSISQAWRELSSGRTTIIIAHRLSTILGSDRVAILNNGELVSIGHHSMLLENCPIYRQLFEEQYVLREEAAAV